MLILTLSVLLAAPLATTAAAPHTTPTAVTVVLEDDEEEERVAPTKEQVAAAITALKEAWKSKEVAQKTKALEAAKDVVHSSVISEVAKGLKDKEHLVFAAAVDALRWMEHPDALAALTKHWKKDKELRKDVELAPMLLKAIGQHAHPSSISTFADNPLENVSQKCIQARILGLGRIRDAKAIDELIDMLSKVGTRGGGRGGRGGAGGGPNMNDFRTALMVLTGRDLGRDANAWKKWWDDHQKGFEVSAVVPELPRDVLRPWNDYWGLTPDDERPGERENRGDGPEDRGGR